MAEISREHYTCTAAIIWCFDDRFNPALIEIREKIGGNCDVVSIAGGAKDLVNPERSEHRDYLLRQIELSIKLHDTRRVILMTHSDCGAFGGLTEFGGSEEKEFATHEKLLQAAKTVLEARFPDIKIETHFCNFTSCLII
jgi:carbonic anhydrase